MLTGQPFLVAIFAANDLRGSEEAKHTQVIRL